MREIINASLPKIFIICLFVVPTARSIPICFFLSFKLLLNELIIATQEAKISTAIITITKPLPENKLSTLVCA